MDIKPIQHNYRLQNVANTGRVVKKAAEEFSGSASEMYGKDKIAISSEASFKAELYSCAKAYACKNRQPVPEERIEELKKQYAGDNCPVSGHDIASAVIRNIFGTAE